MVLSDEAQVTLNRYAARNDYSQPDIVKALRAVGFTVDIIGWPVDLLLHSPTNDWRDTFMRFSRWDDSG
jgi:hypothetical protein